MIKGFFKKYAMFYVIRLLFDRKETQISFLIWNFLFRTEINILRVIAPNDPLGPPDYCVGLCLYKLVQEGEKV